MLFNFGELVFFCGRYGDVFLQPMSVIGFLSAAYAMAVGNWRLGSNIIGYSYKLTPPFEVTSGSSTVVMAGSLGSPTISSPVVLLKITKLRPPPA